MKKLSHLLIAISAIILSSFMFVGGCNDDDGGTTIPDIPTSIGGDMSMDLSMDIGDPFNSEEPAASEEEASSSVEETPSSSEEDLSSEEGPTMDGWDDI